VHILHHAVLHYGTADPRLCAYSAPCRALLRFAVTECRAKLSCFEW
jgi:hypothetical protein